MRRIAIIASLVLNVVLLGVLGFAAVQASDLLGGRSRLQYARMQTQFEELSPSGGIVLLGDSITRGGHWHELLERPDVFNRGIGGDTTAGVLARLDTIVAIAPRQIFLMIGVNDLNRRTDPAQTLANYEKILDALRQRLPGTRVVVQSVLPVSRSWRFTDSESIRALNVGIERIARERGLRYLDLNPFFADENGDLRAELTNDGIHLLGPGYALWRDRLRGLLAPPSP